MEQLIKVLHIDDDIETIHSLKTMLNEIEGIEYLKGFTSPIEAVEFIKEKEVDLVFLDVEMPEHDGFWVAEQLSELHTKVIFVTGHSGYAIQAFEVCALNYVQKPATQHKLLTVVEQALENRYAGWAKQEEQIKTFHSYIDPSERPKNIFVTTATSINIIKLEDIFYFISNRNYTEVVSKTTDRLTSSKTIKTFEVALQNNETFKRISRSYLINIGHLKTIYKDSKLGKVLIEMANGDKLVTSFKTKEEAVQFIYNS